MYEWSFVTDKEDKWLSQHKTDEERNGKCSVNR